MPPSYITISENEYRKLLNEVKRGVEVCEEVSDLRLLLQALVGRLSARGGEPAPIELKRTIESCGEVSRLRVELAALGRRLREFEEEVTPIRPPSRTDIQAAFTNSSEFLQGKKKPFEKPLARKSVV